MRSLGLTNIHAYYSYAYDHTNYHVRPLVCTPEYSCMVYGVWSTYCNASYCMYICYLWICKSP